MEKETGKQIMGTVDDMLDRHEGNRGSGKHDYPSNHVWAATGPMIDLDRNRQIERLARALLKHDNDFLHTDWEHVLDTYRIYFRAQAKSMFNYMEKLEVE